MDPQLVSYATTSDFLDAILPFDCSDFNEAVAPSFESALRGESADGVRVVVWDANKPVVVFCKLSESAHLTVSTLPAPRDIDALVSVLAAHLLTLPTLEEFSVFGPSVFTIPFAEAYQSLPTQPQPGETYFLYAVNRNTLKESSPSPSGRLLHIINHADLSEEQERQLLGLREGFFAHGTVTATHSEEEARAMLRRAFVLGAIWVWALDNGEIVGYVYTARPTARTVQVRQVFVDERHRGKGIGQAAVDGVTRTHLEAQSGDMVGRWGRKEEVCLLVEEVDAGPRRVYERVGFEVRGQRARVSLQGSPRTA